MKNGKKAFKPTPFSPDLERAVLAALVRGTMSPGEILPEEFSKPAKWLHRAIIDLRMRVPLETALDPESVLVVAADGLGGDRDELRRLVDEIARFSGDGTLLDVVKRLRNRRVLFEMMTQAGAQLQEGVFAPEKFLEIITSSPRTETLQSMADLIGDTIPQEPVGVPLEGLDNLTDQIGGLFGLWAIAGEPKQGKSTIAWQLALGSARQMPVVFYDFENGWGTVTSRLLKVFGGDVGRLREHTKQLYYRQDISRMEMDLQEVGTPALVVVDSVQRLPSSLEFRREGLSRWVYRLEEQKRYGRSVLLVSEIPRSQYGETPSVGVYKETGSIEYSADVGLQLVRDGGGSSLFVVAHRHRPVRGRVATLRRVRDWWFEEA